MICTTRIYTWGLFNLGFFTLEILSREFFLRIQETQHNKSTIIILNQDFYLTIIYIVSFTFEINTTDKGNLGQTKQYNLRLGDTTNTAIEIIIDILMQDQYLKRYC